MHKLTHTLTYTLAALLLAASAAHAQTNGVPDNDWLMKHPVPSGEAMARAKPAQQAQSAPPVEASGAAASARKDQVTGAQDSNYGRP